ncbi:hypothetical protein [Xanthomonas campestris]|uniref:hypothetical protein n=1 Tax=Xanthomonas campestris TaxID=339 RepID=UPI002B23B81F|nr:hypothetical protein [Xanthomonas campestris]MEA9559568.1 hypothetical protein [Xanthomonas campestris]MEA9721631.1 hypothetical protein [Xanthomonas campestris]MEB1882984.1 hypothetical protein [Xanthomonas campestris pv. campestris]
MNLEANLFLQFEAAYPLAPSEKQMSHTEATAKGSSTKIFNLNRCSSQFPNATASKKDRHITSIEFFVDSNKYHLIVKNLEELWIFPNLTLYFKRLDSK